MSAKPVVYFIDDSATMREVIKIAFNREEMEVITCHDASSAMDLMDHSAPDVVITDVIMPHLSGIDLAIQVLDHCRNCKVLLFSGQTVTASLLKSAQERGYDFELLAKPVHPADLLSKIQRVLDGTPLSSPLQSPESALHESSRP